MKSLLVFLVGALLFAVPPSAVAGKDRTGSEQPSLGMVVMPLRPPLRQHFDADADRGVLVLLVTPGSAAAAAGIAVGDVVTDVRGLPVDDAGDITAALASVKPGKRIAVRVVRDGKPLTLRATAPGIDISAIVERFLPWSALSRPMSKRSIQADHKPVFPSRPVFAP